MLTQERLREVLHYDPETGVFTWRMTRGRAKQDAVAGCRMTNGHWKIGIDGCEYLASRLAWLYMTGRWPALEIDHEDRNPANDRWDNLREATSEQNKWNRGRNRNNTSGYKGIYRRRMKCATKWLAKLNVGAKQMHLGTYDSPEEAHEAYRLAVLKTHGEFAGVL